MQPISKNANFGISEVRLFIKSLKDRRYDSQAPPFASISDGENKLAAFLFDQGFSKAELEDSPIIQEFKEFYENSKSLVSEINRAKTTSKAGETTALAVQKMSRAIRRAKNIPILIGEYTPGYIEGLSPRVIFVGIHNKPDTLPLAHHTRSGKVITTLIRHLKSIEPFGVQRTNLFNLNFIPEEKDCVDCIREWIEKSKPEETDIIVVLGKKAQAYFPAFVGGHKIYLDHPSFPKSAAAIENYIVLAAKKINEILNP